jgi:hypothetical protein
MGIRSVLIVALLPEREALHTGAHAYAAGALAL